MARFKLRQKRLRSPFFKKKKNSSNNGQGSIQKVDRAPSSPEFAAQNSADLGSSGAGSDEPVRTLERPRLVWTERFFDAVAHLGIKNAVAKTIMQLKNDDGDNNGGGGNKNNKKDSYLEIPDLVSLEFTKLPESIKALSKLKVLRISSCQKLRELPRLSSSIINLEILRTPYLKPPDLADCSIPEKLRTKTTADADGDADNDGGDDRDNNGGGGDKNKKKGGGHSDGEGNGDGGDKAEGGDGEEKGMNKDCRGQLGFGYRCTYHAGYENGYPVEQLHALIMFYLFCSENMINYCSIMPPVRDVSLMICA